MTLIKSTPDIPKAALEALREVAGPCTVPLVVGSSCPTEIGTGVFFEVGGVSFIFTADHVVEAGTADGFCISIPCRDGRVPILSDAVAVRPKNPLLDCALLKLSAKNRQDLLDGGLAPIRQDLLNVHYQNAEWPPDPATDFLCLFGYPAATSGWDETTRTVSVGGRGFTLLPHDGSGPAGFDRKLHIALRYPSTDEISVWQADGTTGRAISPKGFSGCGVWTLPLSRLGVDEPAWQSSDLRLVALQHAWVDGFRSAGSARCTRISVAIGMVRKAFPELAPALELVFPSTYVLSPDDLGMVQPVRLAPRDGAP